MNSSTTIEQVLRMKGRDFFSISPGATAYEALEVMAEKNIGALLVVEEMNLVGVFSERDYARKVILKGKSSKSTTVRELMSSPPICGCPALTIRDCMAIMTDKHIRHLPIVEQGAIMGVVSLGDVVKMVISEQDSLIQTLENYVTDTDYRARIYCP